MADVEPLSGASDPDLPISRAYSGSYEECRAAMERDAADLAPLGYHVLTESYGVSWSAGVCVGCLSVEFGRQPGDVTRSPDAKTEMAQP
jgi:hypothetical protein